MKLIKTYFPFIAVLLFTVPAIVPILTPGYFPIHDNTQVVRVSQMTQALLDGQFPVRWVKDLGYGYGYPIFNFYNPLPYYFGSLFDLIGFSPLPATKIMFSFPILAGAIAAFLLTKKYFGNLAALATSVLYTYAPYHAVQVFVRGSVSEYWAYAILPFVFHFLFERKIIASAISISLLILSHNLTALMVIPVLAIIFLIQLIDTKQKLLLSTRYFLLTTISLGLSAFFWLPSFFEKQFTSVDQMVTQQFNTIEHFVSPLQLWHMPWGFGGSAPGPHDGLSFMLGKVNVVFSVLGIVFLTKYFYSKKLKLKDRNSLMLPFFAALLTTFSVFMLLPLSRQIWKNLSLLNFLQFPWRYLAFAAIGTSILSGYSVSKLHNQITKAVSIPKTLLHPFIYLLLILFVLLSAKKFFLPQFKFGPDINSANLLSDQRVKFEVSGRSDEYRPTDAITPQNFYEIPTSRFAATITDNDSITVTTDKTHLLKLSASVSKTIPVALNIFSFPGWKVLIGGIEVETTERTGKRLIGFTLPSGQHNIIIEFVNTPVRTAGNLISLLSIVTVVFLALKKPKILS